MSAHITPRPTIHPATHAATHAATQTASDCQTVTVSDRFAVATDGNAVDCIYDVPSMVSDGLKSAADLINFWVGQHSIDRRKDEARFAPQPDDCDEVAALRDLHLYLPSWSQQYAEEVTVTDVLRDVLAHTVAEVQQFHEADRGHYLVQMLTRWFTDGHIDWLRFRLGHLLAAYYSMMPTVGQSLGLVDLDDTGAIILGWRTPHGVYLDVVHQRLAGEQIIAADVAAALSVGSGHWPDHFAGIRYLPLADLDDARHYRPNGTWVSVVEQDLLGIAAQLDRLG